MKRLMRMTAALLAVVALAAAVGASAASASNFKVGVEPAQWNGSSTGHLTELIVGETFECNHGSFHGETTTKSFNEISVTPNLGGCVVDGNQSTSWATNGCKFRFNANKSSIDITGCEQPMSNLHGSCHITIPNQGGIAKISYRNAATSPPTVVATYGFSGLQYTVEGTCLGHADGTFQNGEFFGEWSISAATKSGIAAAAEFETSKAPPGNWFALEELPATISGSDTGMKARITGISGNDMSCENYSLAGTASTERPGTLTLFPTYKNCTVGGEKVGNEWIGSACNYVFHSSGTLDIEGPECASGTLAISRPGCSVQILTQTGLTGVSYSDKGYGRSRTIVVSGTVEHVKYMTGGWSCSGGEGTFTTGKIVMTAELSATNSKGVGQGLTQEVF